MLSSPVAAAFDLRPPQWPIYLVIALLLVIVVGLLFDWLLDADGEDCERDNAQRERIDERAAHGSD